MVARVRCFARLLVQLLVLVAAVSSAGAGEDVVGTRWAVLIAGSNGYYNYRHQARTALCFHFVPFLQQERTFQADVCHAYQIMKKGGLKDENIIVFMYDDIANNTENPWPGVIINHPNGTDVYAGVPKDYTGEDVNVHNFLAVLLGDNSNLTGGSGKVVDSGPDDHIFVYYADHGSPGLLVMPSGDDLYADDLVDTLKKKHATGTYKSLVFYLEACESGSMFEGLLPADINVYATTASNAEESSWAAYCSYGGQGPPPPPGFDTCLGDLYSVSWMEDSDARDLRNESLAQQYEVVRENTLPHASYSQGSHVMQYGDMTQNVQSLYSFIGTNPDNDNVTTSVKRSGVVSGAGGGRVSQHDADLVYFWNKYRKAGDGTAEKREARERLHQVMARRSQIDSSVERIGSLLFGSGEAGSKVLTAVRPAGQPLADDWDCLKSSVRAYEGHCGPLGQYGMKHTRAFANICNAGVTAEDVAKVAAQACAAVHSDTSSFSSLVQ
ncbi:hypothetical protein EJB05_36359, partial [Eragrostis curvula]